MTVAVIGVGAYPFGRHGADVSALDQAVVAVNAALRDADVRWDQVQFAYGGSHEGGNADTLVNRLGLTGLPFTNVSNGCATGTSALIAARNTLLAGEFDLGLVVGFDKHPRGAFQNDPADWGLDAWYGKTGLMVTTQFFAMRIRRYMHQYQIEPSTLARVADKALRNGQVNPHAWRRTPVPREEILSAPMVADPLTRYMLCSPSEGAVALVVCSETRAREFAGSPVHVRGAALRTRRYGSFEVFSPSLAAEVSPGPTFDAAMAVYELSGLGPAEIDIAQLQDTDAGAELIHMAETGLCEDGEQTSLLERGVTERTGALPINTDGGCLANGEPIGASGLRQVRENVLQLQGRAGERQVAGPPRTALSHVYGAPGVGACTILSL